MRRESSKRHPRWRAAAASAVALAALGLLAPPGVAASHEVIVEDCTAVVSRHEVPANRVRPLVPDVFTLAEDSLGKATVHAFAERCKAMTVNGIKRESFLGASFRVDLALGCDGEPKGSQEFEQCQSRPPLPLHIDDYQFFTVSNNPELISLFRQVGATPDDAVLVENLVFNLHPDGTFYFEAPAPTPSPFKMTAQVEPPVVGPFDLDIHHWGAVPRGLFKIGDPLRISVRIGPASGRLFPEAGSEMAEILCSTDVSWEDPGGIASFDARFAIASVDSLERPASPTERPRCL